MASIDCLPLEVIDYILNCDCISYLELCRLATVSKIFNCAVRNNKLWKKKYAKTWPETSKLYVALNTNWKHEFHVRIDFRRSIIENLSELSTKYYYYENLSNDAFFKFLNIAHMYPFADRFLFEELENGIQDSASFLNLTEKYYGKKALRYMRHLYMEIQLKDYLSQFEDGMSFVEGLCLISQWCQPTSSKCTSEVVTQLDEIGKQVFEKVQELFPYHPLIKKGLTKDDRIAKSVWKPQQCKNILYCLNIVLFQDLKFTGNYSECHSTESIFIDKVLVTKLGINIVIGVIYAAVAARLGVSCLFVNYPGHFLLKWLEYPEKESEEAYTFIDVVENGSFLNYNELPNLASIYQPGQAFQSSWASAVSAAQVFTRVAWYLVEFGRQVDGGSEEAMSLCNALELLCILSPDDAEHKLLLARLYMHLNINIPEAVLLLQEIATNVPLSPLTEGYMYQSTLNTLGTLKHSRPSTKKKVVLRNETEDAVEVKYAVGMVMRHIKYNFRCVIYGWDCSCTASRDWINRMGVHNLIYKDKQPFYYVLVDDGTNRYAAQENLAIDEENRPIPHSKIGKYFKTFHGTYYVPNELTLAEYPQDIEARETALNLPKEK